MLLKYFYFSYSIFRAEELVDKTGLTTLERKPSFAYKQK